MRRRFFVDKFENNVATMHGDAAHHVGRVLRVRTGQQYELSDGLTAWLAEVSSVARDRVEFRLLEPLPSAIISLRSVLLLSVVKFDAFEWALEKATELGVAEIIPVASARSEKGLLAAAPKRAERWRRILLESSQQSRRLQLPVLHELSSPTQAFTTVANAECKLMLSELLTAPPLRKALEGSIAASVALAIGPEGGWTDDEFRSAGKLGFQQASLGKLILRTETAVITALACLNFALEKQ